MTNCLQLDVGNSSAKWRLVAAGQVLHRGRYAHGDDAARQSMLRALADASQVWVSSVAGVEFERAFTSLINQHSGLQPWFARTSAQAAGLKNSYQDPSRMGVDRWLAMLGARRRCEGRLCVIDAGSATTIDLVDAAGQHEGGYIIPGPALMERALLLDTDRVRFAEDVDYALTPGKSTAEAVRHGIALAQVGAVAAVLDGVERVSPELIFSGGAGETLMRLLDRGGLLVPDLVFEGLETLAEEG